MYEIAFPSSYIIHTLFEVIKHLQYILVMQPTTFPHTRIAFPVGKHLYFVVQHRHILHAAAFKSKTADRKTHKSA